MIFRSFLMLSICLPEGMMAFIAGRTRSGEEAAELDHRKCPKQGAIERDRGLLTADCDSWWFCSGFLGQNFDINSDSRWWQNFDLIILPLFNDCLMMVSGSAISGHKSGARTKSWSCCPIPKETSWMMRSWSPPWPIPRSHPPALWKQNPSGDQHDKIHIYI